MGKVAEIHAEAQQLGKLTDRIVRRLNPEGFIEFQLRQVVADAIEAIGKERAMQIIKEAAE
jgi:hypothetical protein